MSIYNKIFCVPFLKKHKLKSASTLVVVALLLAAFQNFKWHELIRGGPENEYFELYDLDQQVDWEASIKDTKAQVSSIYSMLKKYILEQELPPLPAYDTLAKDQNTQSAIHVMHSVRSYLNKIADYERLKTIDPQFVFVQDEQILKEKLPVGPFALKYGEFENNVLDKGNEEYADQIREWRWENWYLYEYIRKGGSPLAALKIHGDPQPMINQAKVILQELQTSGKSTMLGLNVTVLQALPAAVEADTSTAANRLRDTRRLAQDAHKRLAQAWFNKRLMDERYIKLLDQTTEKYARLGAVSVVEYLKNNPLLYNGEDINPILFEHTLPMNLGSTAETEEYINMDAAMAATNFASSVETLQKQKEILLKDYGSEAFNVYHNQYKQCAWRYNAMVASIPANSAQLTSFVQASAVRINEVRSLCLGTMSKKPESRHFLTRLSGVTKAHNLYLDYLLRQKSIEDKYLAEKESLKGTPAGDLLEYVDNNYKWIDKDLMMLSDLDEEARKERDKYISNAMRSVAQDDLTSWQIYWRPLERKFILNPEVVIDIPSTLRAWVHSGQLRQKLNAQSGVENGGAMAQRVLGLLEDYREYFLCKDFINDKIGMDLKRAYEVSDYVHMNKWIEKTQSGDVMNYCKGMLQLSNDGYVNLSQGSFVYKFGLKAYGLPADPVTRAGWKDAATSLYSRPEQEQLLQIAQEKFIYRKEEIMKIFGLGLDSGPGVTATSSSHARYKPARPGRTMGTYFYQDVCKKSVLPWRANSSYVKEKAKQVIKDQRAMYNTARNPDCFGIEGGIVLPYRGEVGNLSFNEERNRRDKVAGYFRDLLSNLSESDCDLLRSIGREDICGPGL